MKFLHALIWVLAVSVAHAQQSTEQNTDAELTALQNKIAKVQDIEFLLQLTKLSQQQEDWEKYFLAAERISQLQPQNQYAMFRLAGAYALKDDKSRAYNLLLQMQQLGLYEDITESPEYENLRGFQLYDYIVEQFDINTQPFGTGRVELTADAAYQDLISGISYNPKTGAYLLGSMSEGRIVSLDKDGVVEDFVVGNPDNGIAGVQSLAVDTQRDFLWVVSAASPGFKGTSDETRGYAMLHKLSLETGEPLGRFPLTLSNANRVTIPGPLTLANNGDVYVGDSASPTIFKFDAAKQSVGVLVQMKGYYGISGLTLHDNQRFLYFADPVIGIGILDLAQQGAYKLTHERVFAGGTTALTFDDNRLFLLQAGLTPTRVMRLDLDDSGVKVADFQPLDSSHPSFSVPVGGVWVGDDYHVLGNSQRHLFDRSGEAQKPLERWQIFAVDTDFEPVEEQLEPVIFKTDTPDPES